MSTRTITLSGRPPVRIEEDNWPMVASARDKEFDNQYEFQANQTSKWFIGARRHEDGRAIVYAIYSYSSNWADRRDLEVKRGVLLPADSTPQDICDAIREVCDDIADAEHSGEDASRWSALATKCIADMPAEELS